MWLTWGKEQLRTELWWGNWKGDHLEGLGVDRRVILKLILGGYGKVVGWCKRSNERYSGYFD
jgi:hypothetical protein